MVVLAAMDVAPTPPSRRHHHAAARPAVGPFPPHAAARHGAVSPPEPKPHRAHDARHSLDQQQPRPAAAAFAAPPSLARPAAAKAPPGKMRSGPPRSLAELHMALEALIPHNACLLQPCLGPPSSSSSSSSSSSAAAAHRERYGTFVDTRSLGLSAIDLRAHDRRDAGEAAGARGGVGLWRGAGLADRDGDGASVASSSELGSLEEQQQREIDNELMLQHQQQHQNGGGNAHQHQLGVRGEGVLRGHGARLTALCVFGAKLLCGTADSDVHLWNTYTWRCERVLSGHAGGVAAIVALTTCVLSVGWDRLLRVWNPFTWQCDHERRTPRPLGLPACAVKVGEGTVAVGFRSGAVACVSVGAGGTTWGWTLADGKGSSSSSSSSHINGHDNNNNNNNGSDHGLVGHARRCEVRGVRGEGDMEGRGTNGHHQHHKSQQSQQGEEGKEHSAPHSDSVTGVLVLERGKGTTQLITFSLDGSVKTWQLPARRRRDDEDADQDHGTPVLLHTARETSAVLCGALVSPHHGHGHGHGESGANGHKKGHHRPHAHLVLGLANGEISRWDAVTLKPIDRFQAHTRAVTCVVGLHNRVVSGSLDSTLRVWDATTGEALTCLSSNLIVRQLVVVGDKVASAGDDRTARLWDIGFL